MRLFLLSSLFWCFSLLAAEEVNLRNDREGVSYYSTKTHQTAMRKALKKLDGLSFIRSFSETLKTTEPEKLCAINLYQSFEQKVLEIDSEFKEMEGAILYLRSQNEFDDVVTDLLLNAHEFYSTKISLPKSQHALTLPKKQIRAQLLRLIDEFKKKLSKTCLDEAYFNLFQESLKIDKTLKTHHFEALFVEAFKNRLIDFDTYVALEKARVIKLEEQKLSLRSYYKKRLSLRIQYPLRDPLETSTFVTSESKKLKLSRRQKLLNEYSDLQIILMANIIKKLKSRIESPKAEILIYNRENEKETISLEPLERFRLAIKLLRKEMAELVLNTYFSGRAPDYMDLMVASYEVGIIPASELEEISSLEEIWSPEKTLWEKSQLWVRTFGTVLTIAIPPPYGFIPVLAIVVIEMTARKNNTNDDPTVIF